MNPERDIYGRAERRIELGTWIVGAVGAAICAKWLGMRTGAAVLCGTLLSWLNFRLLSQLTGTMVALMAGQTEQPKPKVPGRIYIRLLGLLVLLLLTAYVMLALLKLPVLPLVGGLLAVVPAILLELISERMHGHGAPGHM